MKQLLNLRLFPLLTGRIENNQVENEIPDAYEDFAVKIFDILKVESGFSELCYNLGFIRLELIRLREGISDKMKKNVLIFVNKSISLLDIELRIMQWQLQNKLRQEQTSKVTGSVQIKWTGTATDLVEFAYGALETKRFN